MKKIILPLFFLFISHLALADTLQFSTYIAPPINTFSRLLLRAQAQEPLNCVDGTVYLDSSYDLTVCMNNTSHHYGSPWAQRGNIIYLRDGNSNTNLKVGIGTVTPEYKLHLVKENNQNKLNSIGITTLGQNLEHLSMEFETTGTPNGALGGSMKSWADYIEFHVATGTDKKVGRIIYADRRNSTGVPWAPSGMGFESEHNTANIFDIWLDGDNTNIGIGMDSNSTLAQIPNHKLKIYNGNLKANNIYFSAADGSNPGALKVSYNSSGTGAYYAVLAP